MISCLTNYIGLEGITTDPKSGRYINEMPGIDTNQFDLIRDDEWYDTEAAWNALENRTIRRFESRVNQWAIKYYSNTSAFNTFVTGQYDEKSTISNSANYAGILFSNPYTYVQNVSIKIQDIKLYSETNVNTTIRIFNASTGDLLHSQTADLVGGQVNRVTIGKEYPIWRYPHLFICYDESEVSTIKADDGIVGNYVNTSSRRIAKSAEVITNNLTDTGTTGQGLILTYNMACTLDNFICNRLSYFQESYMLLLCAEFCQERIYSDRVSQFTLIDREKAVALRDEYLDDFDKAISSALKDLSISNQNDYCFNCEGLVSHKTLLP